MVVTVLFSLCMPDAGSEPQRDIADVIPCRVSPQWQRVNVQSKRAPAGRHHSGEQGRQLFQ